MSVSGSSININTLAELLRSSESISAALDRYVRVKEQAEKALADLDLGKNVKALHSKATEDRAEATKTLERAKAEAERLVGEAQIKAQGLVKDASSQHAASMAEICQSKQTHRNWLDNSKSEVDALKKATVSAKAEADKLAGEAKTKLAETDGIKREAEDAKKKAQEAEATFRDKSARLTAVIGE